MKSPLIALFALTCLAPTAYAQPETPPQPQAEFKIEPTFEEMSEAARRVAAADAGSAQAEAMLAMLEQARRLGLETAEELARLMERVQGEAIDLVGRAMQVPEE